MTDLSIAALALETGIPKETLRMWERRYGFPQPTRNARGERRYPVQQVARLRQVRRLLDLGMRPGQVLTLSPEELEQAAPRPPSPDTLDPGLVDLIKRHDDEGLRQELRARLLREGLRRFVCESAAGMLTTVGDGWARGVLEVFEEHHFSAQLDSVLREAVAQLPPGARRPRVLLTTLSGEPHTLGLMLAFALLRVEGAAGILLGAQTPESQIVAAAEAFAADAVALSFSEYVDPGAVRLGVRRLRQALPPDVALWCGGRSAQRLKRPPAGVVIFSDLEQLAAVLESRGVVGN
ncbi:MerR family transcriptional regulator [Immundisolibacter sp.]|uniref:MerR family transcriptional regulator n=1 Tax=Immundisolibacter sp. TaxID=1934948 RepID=UPI00260F5464|nr:MerR family transcriptional regulator [Immundisolibacter sp.]MDD3649876.1 MerR family transcriptional regulator [Immundisolibacter sp.]